MNCWTTQSIILRGTQEARPWDYIVCAISKEVNCGKYTIWRVVFSKSCGETTLLFYAETDSAWHSLWMVCGQRLGYNRQCSLTVAERMERQFRFPATQTAFAGASTLTGLEIRRDMPETRKSKLPWVCCGSNATSAAFGCAEVHMSKVGQAILEHTVPGRHISRKLR